MASNDVDYSIVIPVYYNEECLIPLMRSLKSIVIDGNPNYIGEVIFIDDGSGDGSFAELRRIQEEFPALVTIIKLTRNFGQGGALMAGYHHARGRCILTMAADGQEPPELINDMLKAFFEEGYEVVICARGGRDESRYRIITSHLYYYMMRKLAFREMPKGGFDFWLFSRRALQALIRNADPHLSFQGQVLWMGFKTKFISYRRRARLAGASRMTFARKLTGFLDGVIGYSFTPIRAMSFAGCIFALLGFLYAVVILIDGLFFGNPVKGWSPLMIVVLVMGGVQMIMLGLIGEYLWRTLTQVRRRDMYLIDTTYESKPDDASLRAG